jgi:hypothetical protein
MNLREAEEYAEWLSYRSDFAKVSVHEVQSVINYLIAELKRKEAN